MTTTISGTNGVDNIAPGTILQEDASTLMLPLGVGQTWQNVTGSRSAGVTYTNTTGRPINVVVSGRSTSTSCQMTLTVSGVVAGESYYFLSAGSSNIGSSVSAVVPNGATYIVAASLYTISIWSELR